MTNFDITETETPIASKVVAACSCAILFFKDDRLPFYDYCPEHDPELDHDGLWMLAIQM